MLNLEPDLIVYDQLNSVENVPKTPTLLPNLYPITEFDSESYGNNENKSNDNNNNTIRQIFQLTDIMHMSAVPRPRPRPNRKIYNVIKLAF